MLFPEHLEEKLGFDEIRQYLTEACCGEAGAKCVEQMRFSASPDQIRKFCNQAAEFIYILTSGNNLAFEQYQPVDKYYERIRVEGAFLEPESFHAIRMVLNLVLRSHDFLMARQSEFPLLSSLIEKVYPDRNLVPAIDRCIDEKGEMRDNASSELSRIRREIYKQEQKARTMLTKIMGSSRKAGYVPDEASLTIRSGRLVIPVKAEYKRVLKGFIHDESATGSLVYIEPAEILEINNEIRDLEYQQKREIIRILTSLTDQFRPHLDMLKLAYEILGKLDFIRAKAKLAISMEAITPEITNTREISWINARHPLLERTLAKQQKKIVPLSINLHHQQRILVISGPNAGGKSVCLKTVGLLQYMLQCGLAIPVQEGSKSGVFKDMFIDIGDEQSIESDLSTYSSHLIHMRHFVMHATKHSLFLIDEFGTGTDPQFGGAIAAAILEALHKGNAYGLVTTHYSNLKKLADSTPGMANGRMRFDVGRLEPLYELESGKPGSSFALEIAHKIGLPKEIIANARAMIGTDQIELDRLLNDLEKEKQMLESSNKAAQEQKEKLSKTLSAYEQLKSTLETEKQAIIRHAKLEAKQLLTQSNQRIEATIREIKEVQAEKNRTRQLREELKEIEREVAIDDTKVGRQDEAPEVILGEIATGDFVRLIGQETVGEVVKLSKNQAEVVFGGIKTNIKVNRLERISATTARKEIRSKGTRIGGIDINTKKSEYSSELDLRGKRAEEVHSLLNSFIDSAILFGMPSVRILHGKGNGVIRQVVREQLKQFKEISKLEDEHADRGGAGITIVSLR